MEKLGIVLFIVFMIITLFKNVTKGNIINKYGVNRLYDIGIWFNGNKRGEIKISRNQKCPCNSGKKYKNCCGAMNKK